MKRVGPGNHLVCGRWDHEQLCGEMEMQSSGAPRVSVIMVTRNHGGLLREAVRSALDQSLSDLEVVLVDNGSTDGSVDALVVEVSDARLRVIRWSENRGIANGTNAAIQAARGEWIAVADTDDVIHQRRLELQLAAVGADPSLAGVSCDLAMIGPRGEDLGRMEYFHRADDIRAYAPFNMPVAHVGLFLRRAVALEFLYRPEFVTVSDYDMLTRLLEHYRLAALPLPLYRWRRHQGSVSFVQPAQMEAYTCMVRIAAARRRAGRPERLDELARFTARALEEPDIARVYLRFAQLASRERCPLLACLHAALARRHGGGLVATFSYAANLLRTFAQTPGALGSAWGGLAKGPFWMLLKREGFPAFPRY